MRVATESSNNPGPPERLANVPHPATLDQTAASSPAFSSLIELVQKALVTRYRDIEPVGAGRSGFVFRARPVVAADAPERDEHVAIKVSYPGLSEESAAWQRFVREATVGARLRHPHIVRTGARQSLQGVTWFEMPLLGVFRLDRVLRNGGALAISHAMDVLRDIAGALDYAATQGVAHGALRPSEAYILPDGRVVLTGFLVDLRQPRDGNGVLTPRSLGDPAYMAPEQWTDRSDTGPAADQYSLAILAAVLIGGVQRVVRHGAGNPEVLPLQIGRDRPLRPGLGLHVNETLLRATSRDPHLRFETSSLFVLALGDPSRTAHRTLPTYGTDVQVPRVHHWGFVAAMLVAALAVALYFMR